MYLTGSQVEKTNAGIVVIVDDDCYLRASLRGIVETIGFKVIDFETGIEAIKYVTEQCNEVDVILTDISMPEMNGLELLDRVQVINAEIPVILMTAFAEIDLTVKAIKKGAFDFIIKPYEHEYILRAVEKGVTYRRLRRLEINYREELEAAFKEQSSELKKANEIVLQNEKMALIGQITAGIAHEINNPVGFISSNIGSAEKYAGRLFDFVSIQSDLIDRYCPQEEIIKIREVRKKIRLDTIIDNFPQLLEDSQDGISRIKEIVTNLKVFTHVEMDQFILTTINDIIEKALKIVWNELKYVASVVKDLGDIPPIQCLPNQLTQVFMNLLINAAHAIVDHGEISIRTWQEADNIYISISDTGCGIPEDVKNRIFEPFFTTKEVGKGTGLGLSVSYDIIRKHSGEITVESKVGSGTTFKVRLPIVL